MRGVHLAVMVTAIVLAAATAALALASQWHRAYHRQAKDLALETAASVIGLLAYLLIVGRLCRHTRLNDLMLACALAVLALSNVFLVTLPVVAGWAPDDLTVWGSPVAYSLGALLFVLAGRALSQAAVLQERQRIACELHDGVAQELAYLARNLESLGREADQAGVARLRRAVERAQLESRRLISAMAAPSGQPFETALAEAVTEIAERYHVKLDLDLTSDIRLPAPRREALVRIACEAVTNAARHSGADRVNLGLEQDGSSVRLRVSDNGHGFDTADPGGGFGLTSMRERAHSVGAELIVSSEPGHGSQVEVAV